MWPSNPDRWKDVVNSFAVIGILLGMLVLLLFIGRSANGTYDAGVIGLSYTTIGMASSEGLYAAQRNTRCSIRV